MVFSKSWFVNVEAYINRGKTNRTSTSPSQWNALIFLDFFLLPTCNNDRDLLAANIAPTEVLGAVVLAWGSTILFSSVMVTVGLGNWEVTRDLMTMTR